jgi:hypothetical protein
MGGQVGAGRDMGRKQDINFGAASACLVVAALVGLGTQSCWGGVAAFVGLAVLLGALRIIR